MRRIQIADLDGCIADDRWRRKFILDMPLARGPGWEDKYYQYHRKGWQDKAANLDQITPGAEVVFLTGRPLRFREQTLAWLGAVARVRPLYTLFRPNGDVRASVVVKSMQLQWLLNDYNVLREEIIDAIDDRQDIVTMYQLVGLPARVVRIGTEEHTHG